jgi:hypothetical protein
LFYFFQFYPWTFHFISFFFSRFSPYFISILLLFFILFLIFFSILSYHFISFVFLSNLGCHSFNCTSFNLFFFFYYIFRLSPSLLFSLFFIPDLVLVVLITICFPFLWLRILLKIYFSLLYGHLGLMTRVVDFKD